MSELMVQIPYKKHPDADKICVELNSFYAVNTEFFEMEEFFESGEEPLDSGSFLVFLFELRWIPWSDPGSCSFDDGGNLVLEQGLSNRR